MQTKDLVKLVKGKTVSFDFEYDPDTYNPTAASNAYEDKKGNIESFVTDFRFCEFPGDALVTRVFPILNSASRLISQNAQAELKVLVKCGFPKFSLSKLIDKIEDTMLLAHVVNTEALKDLDTLGQKILGIGKLTSFKEAEAQGSKDQKLLTEIYGTHEWYPKVKRQDIFIEYSRQDSVITLRIFNKIFEDIKATEMFPCYVLEKQLLKPIMWMYQEGFPIDRPYLYGLEKDFEKHIIELMETLTELCGMPFFVKVSNRKKDAQQEGTINFASPAQLGKLLYDKMKFPVISRTDKGAPSTDAETLEGLLDIPNLPEGHYKFINTLGEYRSFAKLKSSFVSDTFYSAIESDGCIRTSFNSTLRTGRFSASGPPMQTLPKAGEGFKIRGGFVAPDDYLLLDCDYSQIEYRFLAHFVYLFTGDMTLVKAFRAGLDVHEETARMLSHIVNRELSRNDGKTFNFAMIYGLGIARIAAQLNISIQAAKELYKGYFRSIPGMEEFKAKVIEFARNNKYIMTISGRKRSLHNYAWQENGSLERIAVNTLIQGSSADLIKLAMVNLHTEFYGKDFKLHLQVHDELIASAPKEKAPIYLDSMKKVMENCFQLEVPIIVDGGIGLNWKEAKENS